MKSKVEGKLTVHGCFAYQNGKCKVLTVSECEGSGCGFFKTVNQLELERIETMKRICSLNMNIQKQIAEMYYIKSVEEVVFSGINAET